jgi:hypothetical protein
MLKNIKEEIYNIQHAIICGRKFERLVAEGFYQWTCMEKL